MSTIHTPKQTVHTIHPNYPPNPFRSRSLHQRLTPHTLKSGQLVDSWWRVCAQTIHRQNRRSNVLLFLLWIVVDSFYYSNNTIKIINIITPVITYIADNYKNCPHCPQPSTVEIRGVTP